MANIENNLLSQME